MLQWNHTLFLLVNAPARPGPAVLAIAIILAESPPVFGGALLVGLWVWGMPGRRSGLLVTAAAVLVGQGFNQAIGVVWFEPRPFMLGVGHTLIVHAADNSFPSDHATFVWTLGAGLIATDAAQHWGALVCIYGLGVAWARIFLGVYIAASALVAMACGCLAGVAQPVVRLLVLPVVEGAYETSLRLLRLPPALIPRRSDQPKS